MRVVIMGGGISGHTAAIFLRDYLKKNIEVTVVTPNFNWNWIPSNVWVGAGTMAPEKVVFPLKPVYDKIGVDYRQAKALSVHPEGNSDSGRPYITIEYTSTERAGETETVEYDFLVNATGPKLNFDATPGLGPDHNSLSICTPGHATQAAGALKESIQRMKKGEHQTFIIGTGHGMATCQGAAFEYIFNVEYELRKAGVRDKGHLIWVSNEYELGDFGVGGMHLKKGGYISHSKMFTESLYAERGIRWQTRSHVHEVGQNEIYYENLAGEEKHLKWSGGHEFVGESAMKTWRAKKST